MKAKKQRKPPLFVVREIADLISHAFDTDLSNVVPVNPKVFEAFRNAQLAGHQKKLRLLSETKLNEQRELAAYAKFLDTAAHLRAHAFVPPNMGRMSDGRNPRRGSIPDLLFRARSWTRYILGDLVLDDWFAECRHGPNTTNGVPFRDSGNSRKWQPPLSCSDSARGLFELYLRWDRLAAKCLRSATDERKLAAVPMKVVNWSVLTTVPKNDKVDRTIAIEPTVNMFLQQGLGRYIAKKLIPFGLDLQSQQDHHREMAFLASLSREYATIDFSSASDCVSTDLLRFLMPPDWFEMVLRIRCETVSLKKLGLAIPIDCIATMGNATTFALETLVFFVLALACIDSLETTSSRLPNWESLKRVTVFGDDCILPCDATQLFIELCEEVGFIVNEEKSFVARDDPFRESCGADFYAGVNIRPVFMQAPRSEKSPSVLRAWLYTMWNVHLKKAISVFGETNYVYCSTLSTIAELICKYNDEIYVVCASDPDDSGVKTYGDWERLSRLFLEAKVAPFKVQHNLIRYRKLVSVAPDTDGTVSPEMEMWFQLKFPTDPLESQNVDVRPDDRKGDSLYNIVKRNRGYVVGSGLDYSGSLVAAGSWFGVTLTTTL